MSIAVLRTFITKRREEHEARLSKRTKTVPKASDLVTTGPDLEEVPIDSATNNEISNGGCGVSEKILNDEPHGISEEPLKTVDQRAPGVLKPPRVLEVFAKFLLAVIL